jgi:hypothetical protein
MTLPVASWREALLTNRAYGYPNGGPRRVAPVALLCVHITANPSTPPAAAMSERTYANRAGSDGPSAHYYLDRDIVGGVHAIDWTKYAAWSNGDVNKPKTAVSGMGDVLALAANGFNANEAYWLEVECCGNEANGFPITDKQVTALALLAAEASRFSGLSISRATVHAHSDLNTVTRASCPSKAAESLLAEVITRATGYANEMFIADLQAKVNTLTSQLAAENSVADDLHATVASLSADLKAMTAARDAVVASRDADWTAWNAYADTVKSRAGAVLALDAPVRS